MTVKKIYFIKRAGSGVTVSGKWRNTLKQTYKSSDAIRDIIDWSSESREFYVAIRDLKTGGKRLVYHVNPPGSNAIMTDFATKRPVIGIIDMILSWTRQNIEFDITLLERRRTQRGQAAAQKPPRLSKVLN
jgi:hypothetical protein